MALNEVLMSDAAREAHMPMDLRCVHCGWVIRDDSPYSLYVLGLWHRDTFCPVTGRYGPDGALREVL